MDYKNSLYLHELNRKECEISPTGKTLLQLLSILSIGIMALMGTLLFLN